MISDLIQGKICVDIQISGPVYKPAPRHGDSRIFGGEVKAYSIRAPISHSNGLLCKNGYYTEID